MLLWILSPWGVDINTGPLTRMSSPNFFDNRRGNEWNGNNVDERDKNETTTVWENTCENRTLQADHNGIQHIVGNITNDLYALPMKKCLEIAHDQIDKISSEKDWNSQNKLPPGWEKHEGQYISNYSK